MKEGGGGNNIFPRGAVKVLFLKPQSDHKYQCAHVVTVCCDGDTPVAYFSLNVYQRHHCF